MIPKIIHYCWFGGNPKPEIVEKCIQSWKKFCPDWEIKEWNESNFDVNSTPFTAEAYASKKWAFVSDVARLAILKQHGGVYMDTDVEIKESIDKLLDYNAFFVFESNRYIATGLGFGCIAEHPAVNSMLEFYNGKHFIVNGKIKMIPCPAGNTEALCALYREFRQDGTSQKFSDVLVVSPADYNRCAHHYGAATWVEGEKPVRKAYRDTRLKRYLRRPSNFNFVDAHFGKKAVKAYTFLVYDLMESGPIYYLRRLIKKKFYPTAR